MVEDVVAVFDISEELGRQHLKADKHCSQSLDNGHALTGLCALLLKCGAVCPQELASTRKYSIMGLLALTLMP